ncbi:MAG: hypothetical protein K0R58_1879 [Ramlibacter sp.]|jgi:hypothetical protein|nr:hypothetical protein [Ramlibacter sp.]
MKSLHLPLVLALASLGLAACDVRTGAPESSTTASAPASQPSTPVDATPTPVQPGSESTAAAPAPATDPTAAGTAPVVGAAPDTSALGAPAADQAAVPEGVAAPTELSRFLEENAARQAADPSAPKEPTS